MQLGDELVVGQTNLNKVLIITKTFYLTTKVFYLLLTPPAVSMIIL